MLFNVSLQVQIGKLQQQLGRKGPPLITKWEDRGGYILQLYKHCSWTPAGQTAVLTTVLQT